MTRQPGAYTLTVKRHFEKLCIIGVGTPTIWSSEVVCPAQFHFQLIRYFTMSLCLFAQVCFYCDYVFNYVTLFLCPSLLLLWLCIQLCYCFFAQVCFYCDYVFNYVTVSLPKSASVVIMYSTMSLCFFAQICFYCDYVFNYATVSLPKSASIVIMYSTMSLFLCPSLLLLWLCIQLCHCFSAQVCFYCDYVFNYVTVSLPKSASVVIMYSTMSLCFFAQVCFYCDYVFNYVTVSLPKSASIVITYSTMSLCFFT